MGRTIDQLLGELRVTSTFGIETERVTAAPSATPAVARKNAEDLARDPKYGANSGRVSMLITKDEMDALLEAGAPGPEIQVIRSFKNEELSTTFSDHCSNCQRWIHLGDSEREGQCYCGKVYRVVFDQTPQDWSMRQGMVCMDCGAENGYSWPDQVSIRGTERRQIRCSAMRAGRRTRVGRFASTQLLR